MKNLFIILSLSFISIIGYSEPLNDSLPLNTTEAERIIDKYSSKISDSFETGLSKITPVAEEGFKIAVRLQIAEGIAHLLLLPLVILFYFQFRACYKEAKLEKKYDWSEGNRGIEGVLFLILSGIGAIFVVPCTYIGITRLLAPEWFAIKEIIQLF